MPDLDRLTRTLDEAWRARDYEFALYCIREVLSRHRGASQSHMAYHVALTPSYSNIAAAFDAEDVLNLIDRVTSRIAAKDAAWRKKWNPEGMADERRRALETMRWLRHTVEQAGSIELSALTTLAERERFTKVKTHLNWMAKASVIHFVEGVVQTGPPPEALFEPLPSHIGQVPRLEPRSSPADATQLAFFEEFEARYRAGERVELEGQWSYAFQLLLKYQEEYRHDRDALREVYERFDHDYPDSPVAGYSVDSEDVSEDDFFEVGDWQGGWDFLIPDIPMHRYLTLASVVADSHLKVETVEGWTRQSQRTTETFRHRKAEVDAVLQDLLDASHDALGHSIVVDLWNRLIVDRAPGAPGPAVEDEFGGFLKQPKIDDYLAYYDKANPTAPFTILQEVDSAKAEEWGPHVFDVEPDPDPDAIAWPGPECHSYWFEPIMAARLQSLYRDAENIVRRDSKMPAVGEGWISEVLLLRSVRAAFSDQRVEHQASPAWLGQQSLDIYLPDHNVAIEYQGLQHSRPVSLFGGELAFDRQLERDARKRSLCLANGCHLIEVHPGYDLDSVLRAIADAIRP